MCMLFIANNSDAADDEFALVVVSIRDEQYNRNTRACQQWATNPSVYGGMDMQEGLEGGTWLAVNAASNKVGAVLRVMRPPDRLAAHKHTRGFLVPTFMDSALSGVDYVQTLPQTARDYPEYVFVAIDIDLPLQPKGIAVSYYSNAADQPPVISDACGIYAFGNSVPHRPWLKTRVGREQFSEITSQHVKVSQRQTLCEKLFEFCSDDTEYFPDEVLQADGRGFNQEHLRGLSSINCKIPTAGFGTRTQTIILGECTAAKRP